MFDGFYQITIQCIDADGASAWKIGERNIPNGFAELGIRLYNPMERVVAMRQINDERPA